MGDEKELQHNLEIIFLFLNVGINDYFYLQVSAVYQPCNPPDCSKNVSLDFVLLKKLSLKKN